MPCFLLLIEEENELKEGRGGGVKMFFDINFSHIIWKCYHLMTECEDFYGEMQQAHVRRKHANVAHFDHTWSNSKVISLIYIFKLTKAVTACEDWCFP